MKLIAEFKRRPLFSDDYYDIDLRSQVKAYDRGGASIISVCVGESLGGSWDDVREARDVTDLPIMAKGFFGSKQDINKATTSGANMILLPPDYDLVRHAQLERIAPLVECNYDEIDEVASWWPWGICQNARDVNTGEFRSSLKGLASLPTHTHRVAASGIEEPKDMMFLIGRTDYVLVGSALMKSDDPQALTTLLTLSA